MSTAVVFEKTFFFQNGHKVTKFDAMPFSGYHAIKKSSEYDQELPKSHTLCNPGHHVEEPQNTNSHKTS